MTQQTLPADESDANAISKAFVTDWNTFMRDVSPARDKNLGNNQSATRHWNLYIKTKKIN